MAAPQHNAQHSWPAARCQRFEAGHGAPRSGCRYCGMSGTAPRLHCRCIVAACTHMHTIPPVGRLTPHASPPPSTPPYPVTPSHSACLHSCPLLQRRTPDVWNSTDGAALGSQPCTYGYTAANSYQVTPFSCCAHMHDCIGGPDTRTDLVFLAPACALVHRWGVQHRIGNCLVMPSPRSPSRCGLSTPATILTRAAAAWR